MGRVHEGAELVHVCLLGLWEGARGCGEQSENERGPERHRYQLLPLFVLLRSQWL